MKTKSLLIKSYTDLSNPTGIWHKMSTAPSYIQGINTGNVQTDMTADNLKALISGVPTPWARTKLFRFAFESLANPDPNIPVSGLTDFYQILIGEWKGLMAVLALYPDRISFSDPVQMDVTHVGNYNMGSALGKMLFQDKDLWCNQDNLVSNPSEAPFLQLIYYKEQLVGGTSPLTILFTGIDYSKLKFINDIKWYRNGKFEDPVLLNLLDNDELQKLYLYIKNVNDNIDTFALKVNSQRKGKRNLEYKGLKKIMHDWEDKIKNGHNLKEVGPRPKFEKLSIPFKILFNSEQKVYVKNDYTLSFTDPGPLNLFATINDIQSFLKDDKYVMGWLESSDQRQPLYSSPVYYLKVNDLMDSENPIKYFSVPLSIEAIDIFKNNLSGLLNYVSGSKIQLNGKVTDQGLLSVTLTLEIDGVAINLNAKEYEIEWADQNNKILIWPNFISKDWTSYYYYSEFPSNVTGQRYIPFFKEKTENGYDFIKYQDKLFFPEMRDDVRNDSHTTLDIKCIDLVTYPTGEVSSDMSQYEVLRCNKPIAGLEIRLDKDGLSYNTGYLLVKNPDDQSMGNNAIKDYSSITPKDNAIVGIDFGSNNSCVNYTLGRNTASPQPIPFKNRRLALLGMESMNKRAIAQKDELLFFSNEEAFKGQIKSWLHEHDGRYVRNRNNEEIAGGVPVNENNICVKKMTREEITTQVGILHYNMKWLSDENGLAQKTAFLKAVWLQICADLYAEKYIPSNLRWSYPGAMSSTDLAQYTSIFQYQLPILTTPILDAKFHQQVKVEAAQPLTEAVAVCQYALSQKYALNQNSMFLGIDIGGSTSDLLLMANDINLNNSPRLFKQSSVRIAAGAFFDAVIKSSLFREALYSFHESRQTGIHVENIKDILNEPEKGPFFLNSVFDQLEDNEFPLFYSAISRQASFVFCIPAYVTGLLLYYSGMLVAKTIKENNLTTINEVHLLPFGKGGRLFHWLQAFPGPFIADQYFEDCFQAGCESIDNNLKLRYRGDITSDNKSEVSKGLVVGTVLEYDPSTILNSDIFGEKGIKYLQNGKFIEIDENEIISDSYFASLNNFDFPKQITNFEKFFDIFLLFVTDKTGFLKKTSELKDGLKEIPDRLKAFITNDSEYQKAKNVFTQTGRFEYHQSILIAEGLCFLEDVLIKAVFNQ